MPAIEGERDGEDEDVRRERERVMANPTKKDGDNEEGADLESPLVGDVEEGADLESPLVGEVEACTDMVQVGVLRGYMGEDTIILGEIYRG